jgi:hypothetical protein
VGATRWLDSEGEDFFSFLADLCQGPEKRLPIMYGIGGAQNLETAARPRVGLPRLAPCADRKRRLRLGPADVLGMVLGTIYLDTKFPHPLDRSG